VINAPAQAEVAQTVTFDASASDSANPIVSYEWNLGDGTTANAVTINHAYSTPGVYNVILTLTDDEGLQGTANHQIEISEAPPEPTPEPTEEPPPEPSVPPTGVINGPAQAAAGQEVTFDGTASQPGDGGAIIEYLWDFGDGTDPATGATVTHIYPDAAEYTVILTVTDESDQSGQAQSNIVVEVDPDFGVDPNQQEEGNSDGGDGQQEGGQ
jgi:PKD repeat protein